MAWFNKRAGDAKKWRYGLTGAQLIATPAIPAINVFVHLVTASSILAFVATIAAGFGQLWRRHEHWLRYRATASALDAAKTLRLASAAFPRERCACEGHRGGRQASGPAGEMDLRDSPRRIALAVRAGAPIVAPKRKAK
jgi:hypothetical protein